LGNREGFNFREQRRTTPRIGSRKEEPVWNHDETIRRNIIAYNRDNQIRGWFDMKDGRQWPAGTIEREASQGRVTSKPADIAGPYASKNDETQPEGLTLEKLRLSFVDNDYFASAGQGWFAWGVSWARHKSYSTLGDFQSDLGIDKGSRALDPAFANLNALDCRLTPKVMEALKSCYPEGTVPGVILGEKQ
jgi:hypothetical protein